MCQNIRCTCFQPIIFSLRRFILKNTCIHVFLMTQFKISKPKNPTKTWENAISNFKVIYKSYHTLSRMTLDKYDMSTLENI